MMFLMCLYVVQKLFLCLINGSMTWLQQFLTFVLMTVLYIFCEVHVLKNISAKLWDILCVCLHTSCTRTNAAMLAIDVTNFHINGRHSKGHHLVSYAWKFGRKSAASEIQSRRFAGLPRRDAGRRLNYYWRLPLKKLWNVTVRRSIDWKYFVKSIMWMVSEGIFQLLLFFEFILSLIFYCESF